MISRIIKTGLIIHENEKPKFSNCFDIHSINNLLKKTLLSQFAKV